METLVSFPLFTMAKVDYRTLSSQRLKHLERELWGTLESLRKGELIAFLRGLFTKSEEVMFARRIQIAKLLLTGMPLLEVAQKLGVGIATVQLVDRWLRSGWQDYRKALPPLYRAAGERRKQGKKPYEAGSFTWYRKKYPAYFLLLNMLIDNEW